LNWEKPLTEAIILKRYKRFLADVQIGDQVVTVHVPNTGSMISCWEPNWKCALSLSTNPDRKMPYTLEQVHNGQSWIGVNTGNANKIVLSWLRNDLIKELLGYKTITPEKKVGESRLDFFLDDHESAPSCYVEVKSVTLKLNEIAQFPDAVSLRAQKHLKELLTLKAAGHRAVLLYLVQREDVELMKPARSVDKKYSDLLKEVHSSGVEILVYQCKLDVNGISFGRALPFSLD
jgi:sugar fermentation stimulation protein A